MRSWRALSVCLALALCVFGSDMVFGADEIKIGVMVPLTGPAAADGLSASNSVKLAAEKVNAAGGLLGKKVVLVEYDDRADAKEGIALARKLIEQDKVVAVVGGSYSAPSRAVAPIFQEEGVPFVAAYAVHPDVTKAGDYCFRNGFLGHVEGAAAAYVAVNKLKAKRIALLTTDNDFGRTLVEGFKRYLSKAGKDVQIVSEQVYPFAEKDFKAYLAKIKEANPDLIQVSGYYFHTGPTLKQAREMGITATIMGEEGADSPKLFEIAGPAAEGFIIVTNLDRDDPRPVVQNYIKEYKERHKIAPDMVGASAYDAFMLIADAIKRAGSLDKKAIRKALAETKDYDGLTGVIKGFTPEREVIKNVQVQIVKNGEFRHFWVVTDPEVITP
jgi:branched-chain amino acid transport system substrate-binding protein